MADTDNQTVKEDWEKGGAIMVWTNYWNKKREKPKEMDARR